MSGVTGFPANPVRDASKDRTRPNLEVQDGCGNRCSFCIIPSVRGRSRSAGLESVLEQVRDLAERYCEVVLSGINLGRWGRDLPGHLRFVDLVTAILQRTEVTSVAHQLCRANGLDPRAARTGCKRATRSPSTYICPCSRGVDAVLKRMFRKYRTRHYVSRSRNGASAYARCSHRRRRDDGLSWRNGGEFEESMRFIEQQPFTYLHVFTYSVRPGTLAAEQGQPVPIEVRRERTRMLRGLSDRKNLEFRRRMIGKTLSAVTLDQACIALTSNFLKVQMAQPREPNQMVNLEIGSICQSGLREQTLLPVI